MAFEVFSYWVVPDYYHLKILVKFCPFFSLRGKIFYYLCGDPFIATIKTFLEITCQILNHLPELLDERCLLLIACLLLLYLNYLLLLFLSQFDQLILL